MLNVEQIIKQVISWPEEFCILDCNGASYTVYCKSLTLFYGNIWAEKVMFGERRSVIIASELLVGITPLRPKSEFKPLSKKELEEEMNKAIRPKPCSSYSKDLDKCLQEYKKDKPNCES